MKLKEKDLKRNSSKSDFMNKNGKQRKENPKTRGGQVLVTDMSTHRKISNTLKRQRVLVKTPLKLVSQNTNPPLANTFSQPSASSHKKQKLQR